ncbi:hypothetical protein D9758_005511 [Tetrapyrgos nigripes]|uniref:F-box domain-containing protein n=1 Tax=Tetrapyrgos nigripes TaxID=182062 RepID=A0A8H5GH10_9AGAR|nr:hypothetical protein D9758_005511 [Tetrapyrgos nigripes]
MSAFLELPIEILHPIVLELGNGSNRKCLRSTCKGLSAVVEPILFSEIVLKTDSSALVWRSIPFCEALCRSEDAFRKDQRGLATYVRTLRVNYPYDDASQEILDAWRDILPIALCKLVNLKSFSWEMSRNSQGMYDQVFEVISKLPSLSEFTLAGELLGYSDTIRLDCLHNLRTLLINVRRFPNDGFEKNIFGPLTTTITNSPDIQTLQILAPYSPSKPCSFIDLFKSVLDARRTPALKIKNLKVENLKMVVPVPAMIMPHLQCLSSLEVRSWYIGIGNFWNVLRTANVSLESLIVVCDPDRTLLDYLSHFHSKLQVLQLSGTPAITFQESDELADLFFGSVLPIFAGSLRELKIQSSYEGRWCIGMHNLETLSSCTNLESLSVCLNGDEIVDVMGDVVDHAHSLPRLKSLYLSPTSTRSCRNAPCGPHLRMNYYTQMSRILRETVENLQPTEAHVGTGLCILPFFYTVCRTQDGSLKYEVEEKRR